MVSGLAVRNNQLGPILCGSGRGGHVPGPCPEAQPLLPRFLLRISIMGALHGGRIACWSMDHIDSGHVTSVLSIQLPDE